LSLDFAYLEGMVSRERAQRIVDGMSAQLAAYVQEPARELQSYEVVS
jgi:hypothetical protein